MRAPGVVRNALGFVDEDLVQDTVVAMLCAVHRHDPASSSLRTWLFNKGHYGAIDAYRKRKRRERPARLFHLVPLEYHDQPDPAEPLDEVLDRIDDCRLREQLAATLAVIGPGERRIVVAYLDGIRQAEIGRRLGVSESAVSHALRQFRARLPPRVTDPPPPEL